MKLTVRLHGCDGQKDGVDTTEFFDTVRALSCYCDEPARYFWTVGAAGDASMSAFNDDLVALIKDGVYRGDRLPPLRATFPHYIHYS